MSLLHIFRERMSGITAGRNEESGHMTHYAILHILIPICEGWRFM